MKKRPVNYRKICQDYYDYTDEQMEGMDVHHIDLDRNNNDPENLVLLTPEEHAKIHEDDFVLWAREGSKKGNEAFIKRLREVGPTKKEQEYRKYLKSHLKDNPLHTTPHNEETKKLISEKKKELLKDKTKHPMWGRTSYLVTDPDGNEYIVSGGWKDWCSSRGLQPSNLKLVADGKRPHHKGWKASYYERTNTHPTQG